MKIPSSFQLMGQTVSIHVLDEKDWRYPDAVGYYNPATLEIFVLKRPKAEMMLQTLFHEALHAIFDALNLEKLYTDERVIDTTAGLATQAFISAK